MKNIFKQDEKKLHLIELIISLSLKALFDHAEGMQFLQSGTKHFAREKGNRTDII